MYQITKLIVLFQLFISWPNYLYQTVISHEYQILIFHFLHLNFSSLTLCIKWLHCFKYNIIWFNKQIIILLWWNETVMMMMINDMISRTNINIVICQLKPFNVTNCLISFIIHSSAHTTGNYSKLNFMRCIR